MPRVFVSYRHSGEAFLPGRLRDRLVAEFGADDVFVDVFSLLPGSHFPGDIRSALARAEVMLVVIDRAWVPARLFDPDDYVRMEVAEALRRGIAVVPLLVADARLPAPGDLPDDVRRLAYLQALPLRQDPDFPADMDRVVEAVRRVVAPARPAEVVALSLRPHWWYLAGSAAALAGSVALAVVAMALMTDPPGYLSAGIEGGRLPSTEEGPQRPSVWW